MNYEAITLGPVSISIYSICILIGVLLAYLVLDGESKKNKLNSSFIFNLLFWVVIFGIIGARVYYVLFNLDYYVEDPIEIVKIWNGGLAIHGGIIAGFFVLLYYCIKYKLNLLKMLDISAPALILAQSVGRWGNFFNGEAYGDMVSKSYLVAHKIPSFIIKGMHIEGTYYKPLFLYESIFCLIGFLVMIILRRLKICKTGYIISFYCLWYGIVRFFIEKSRMDSLMLGNIKIAQIISILLIISSIGIFIYSFKKSKPYMEDSASAKEIKY